MENQKNSLFREFEKRQDALLERITKVEAGHLLEKFGGVVLNEKGLSYTEILKMREGIKEFQKERNSCKIKGEKVILNKKLFTAYLNKSNFLLRPVESVFFGADAHARMDMILEKYAFAYMNMKAYLKEDKEKNNIGKYFLLALGLSFTLLYFSLYFIILSAFIGLITFQYLRKDPMHAKVQSFFEEENKYGLEQYLWGKRVLGNTEEVNSKPGFPYQFDFVHTVPDFEKKLRDITALAEEKNCKIFFLLHKSQSGYKFSLENNWFKLTLHRDILFGIEYDDVIVFPLEKQLYPDFFLDREISMSLYDFFNSENGKVFSK